MNIENFRAGIYFLILHPEKPVIPLILYNQGCELKHINLGSVKSVCTLNRVPNGTRFFIASINSWRSYHGAGHVGLTDRKSDDEGLLEVLIGGEEA